MVGIFAIISYLCYNKSVKKRNTNFTSRVLTGGVLIALGGVLIVVSFTDLVFLIYGIPALLIGIFLFFNNKEDDIEQIKK